LIELNNESFFCKRRRRRFIGLAETDTHISTEEFNAFFENHKWKKKNLTTLRRTLEWNEFVHKYSFFHLHIVINFFVEWCSYLFLICLSIFHIWVRVFLESGNRQYLSRIMCVCLECIFYCCSYSLNVR